MTENPEAKHYNPKFRRRRRFQGAVWTPEKSSALSEDGVWCKFHKQRHGYMTLGLNYGKSDKGLWQLLWFCKETGTVLETQTLHPVEPLEGETGDGTKSQSDEPGEGSS